MKRKLIWINLLLATLVALAAVKVSREWTDQKKVEAQIRGTRPTAPKPAAVSIPAPPAPVSPAAYSDIAQKMLFTKERNPNVVVEIPQAPPPKPMPPLPILRGVMTLPSGVLALMSLKADGRGTGIRVGEKIGEFEIAALTRDEISLKWEDKTVTKSVSEMIYHGLEQAPDKSPPTPGSPAKAAAAPTPAAQSAGNGRPDKEVTGSLQGFKTCTPGDTSPNGTVADGFKKVVVETPFGPSCHWEPVK